MLERVQDDLNRRVSACTCVAAVVRVRDIRIYVCVCVCMYVTVVWVCESVSSCALPDVHPRDQAFCTLSPSLSLSLSICHSLR